MNEKPISLQKYICVECQNEYIPKARNQKCCSKSCYKLYRAKAAREKNIVRICSNSDCGLVFKVKLESDPKIYCSKSCAAIINNALYVKRKPTGACEECKTPISSSRIYCKEHKQPVLYERVAVKKTCMNENCNNEFTTMYTGRKFCSQKCRNFWNKKNLTKDDNMAAKCPKCANPKSKVSKVCFDCYPEYYNDLKVKKWLDGEWSGGSERKLSKTIHRYVLEQAGYKCKVCGFNEVHPADGRTILEVNHIDGDGSNHSPDNLEVLCPNHHALTDTYRGRNQGNGRKVYYLRVQR